MLCTLFVQCTGAMAAGKLSQSFLLAVTPTRAGLQLVTNGSLPSQFLIRSADPPQELRFEAPAQ